jgi:hypothetical protein
LKPETLVEEPEVLCPELADALKLLLPLPERMIIDFSMKLSLSAGKSSQERDGQGFCFNRPVHGERAETSSLLELRSLR